MKLLILVRHCEEEEWESSSKNAAVVAHKLKEFISGTVRALTSPLDRAAKTARITAPLLGLSGEVEENFDLMPMDEYLPDEQKDELLALVLRLWKIILSCSLTPQLLSGFRQYLAEKCSGWSGMVNDRTMPRQS